MRFLPLAALALFACRPPVEEPHGRREGPPVTPLPQAPSASASAAPQGPAEDPDAARLACLARLYGGAPTAGGLVVHGAVIPLHGAAGRSPEEILASPALDDLFRDRYPAGAPLPTATPAGDPGRVRVYPLLDARYGVPGPALAARLVAVPFGGRAVSVHPLVAPALGRVVARLTAWFAPGPAGRFLRDLGGTYNDRPIAGTDRKSAHAYGIAIDLSVPESAYWRATPRFSNRYPPEIVAAFEAEGFVWGGRWAHFDTMHFEYRPELFDPACTGRDPH